MYAPPTPRHAYMSRAMVGFLPRFTTSAPISNFTSNEKPRLLDRAVGKVMENCLVHSNAEGVANSVAIGNVTILTVERISSR